MDMLSQVDQPVVVVPRAEWGAAPVPPPAAAAAAPELVNTVVFAYNTGEPPCATSEQCSQTMRKMQQDHIDKGLPDIYYNFCVGGDAKMYEGRGWNPAHSNSIYYPVLHQHTLVIGVIGDGQQAIDSPSWQPPYEMMAPALKLVKLGVKEGRVIEEHNMTEDYEDVGSRQQRGSSKKGK